MNDIINYCADILYKKFSFDVDNIHVVSMGHDVDGRFCYDCCLEKVEKINKKFPEPPEDEEDKYEYERAFVDGGWGGCLCDVNDEGPNRCEECGKALDYSLSETGVKNELEHFLEYGIGEIDNNKAFELHQLFLGSIENKLDNKIIKELENIAYNVLLSLGETIKNRFEILDL